MSDMDFIEKSKFEKLFDMSEGYVLNFNNTTFRNFVIDSVRLDIYGGKYDYRTCSKANLLRRFWEIEPNYLVGKLLGDMLIYIKDFDPGLDGTPVYEECSRIVKRLRQNAPVEDLEAVGDELSEKSFEIILESVGASIDNNKPEEGLDRLHTFVTRYLRHICAERSIEVIKQKPLHSLMGEYIKRLDAEGDIETLMTKRILKSSISILESFNQVRNDHSLAHDNPILNYEESMLIFSNIVSAIRFIQALERKEYKQENAEQDIEDDLPF